MRNPSSEILHQAAKRVHLKTASCAARTSCLETDCRRLHLCQPRLESFRKSLGATKSVSFALELANPNIL